VGNNINFSYPMTLQIEETSCQTHSFEQQSYTFKQPLQFKWVVDLSDVPEFSLIHLVFELVFSSTLAIAARLHQPQKNVLLTGFLVEI
jgi:hypothetical protein